MGRRPLKNPARKRASILLAKLELFFRLTRPLAAVPFAFAFTIGAASAGLIFIDPVRFVLLLGVIVFGLAGGAHILNEIADRAVDAKSSVTKDIVLRRQPFVTGEVSVRAGLILALGLLALAVAVMARLNPPGGLITALLASFAYLYSFPPRLKSRPPLDVLVNAGAAGAVTILGAWYYVAGPIPWSLVIWVAILVAAAYLLTLIVDRREDAAAGVRTTAIALGLEKTIRLSALLYGLAVIIVVIRLASFYFHPSQIPLNFFDVIIFLPLVWGLQGYLKLLCQPSVERAARLMHRAAQAAGASVLIIFILYSLILTAIFNFSPLPLVCQFV